MTVSYVGDVSNGGKFVCFWRVLIRWRGSLYKLIWQDLVCYSVLFVGIYCMHTHALSPNMQLLLQQVKNYLSANLSMFPVPFVLSFFVDQVATKWWHQYQMLPSPDTLAIYTNAAIPGKDDKSRMIRRTIVRYAVLSLVLTLRNISLRIKKRFPTIKHVEEAGLILEEEKIHYDKLESQVTANNWMPLVWAANIATHARNLNKVSSDQSLRLVITELTAHRDKLGTLVGYDLVSIPLVYTQTMVLAVVSYVIITLISHQPIDNGSNLTGTEVFNVTWIIDFVIYVGLMKVATVMLNPFGEDDDDFELNASVDRHITAAYMIVDEMHEEEPEVVKDAYWDEIVPTELPYTIGSMGYRRFEPNCCEDEKEESLKQSKRQLSSKTYPGVASNANSYNNNKASSSSKYLQNNSPMNSIGVLNEHLHYTEPFGTAQEFEVYSGIDIAKNSVEMQGPSTSKHSYNQPRRY